MAQGDSEKIVRTESGKYLITSLFLVNRYNQVDLTAGLFAYGQKQIRRRWLKRTGNKSEANILALKPNDSSRRQP